MAKERILLVDDENVVLRALEKALTSRTDCDLIVVATSDSEEAAAILKNEEQFDILITDLRMKPLNGLDLIDIAQQANPGIKAIVISAYLNEEAIRQIREKGCSAYVRKPFKLAEVFDAIDIAL